MKLVKIGPEWTVFDGEREITVTDPKIAFGYVFVMLNFRAVPCTTPPLHPVRSLTPHPKKRRLSKKMQARVREIKANMPPHYI